MSGSLYVSSLVSLSPYYRDMAYKQTVAYLILVLHFEYDSLAHLVQRGKADAAYSVERSTNDPR